MVPGSKRRPSIVFRCLLFSFQQKLQSVESVSNCFSSCLPTNPFTNLKKPPISASTSAVSSVWFSPIDSNPKAPWNGIGPMVTLNPTVLGGPRS